MKDEKREKESETVCKHANAPIPEKDENVPQNGKINPPENNVRKRKFTWTQKRKEAFQKCVEANKKRIALKNENGDGYAIKKEKLPVQKHKKKVEIEEREVVNNKEEEDKESVCSDSSSSCLTSSSSSSSSASSTSSSTPPPPVKKRKREARHTQSSKKVTQKVKRAIKKSKQELLKSIHSIKKVLNKKPVVKQSEINEASDSESDSYSYSNYYSPYTFI